MKRVYRAVLILLCIALNNSVHAQNACMPIADVTFTIDGISKLSTTVIAQQFALLKNKVTRISDFKTIQVRPKCDVAETATTKCVEIQGLPNFNSSGVPDVKTVRPVQFDLILKKTNFDMRLAKPISCVNFVCSVSIEVNSLTVDGQIAKFEYSDNGQMIAEKLKPEFDLIKPAIYNLQITLNPKAEHLNQLAVTSIEQHSIETQPGSFRVDLRPSNSHETSDLKTKRLTDLLRASLATYRSEMKDANFGKSQVAKFKVKFEVEKHVELTRARYPRGVAPTCTNQKCVDSQLREMAADDKAVDLAYQNFFKDHASSEEKMALAAKNTIVPPIMTDDQLIAFFTTPPKTLNFDEINQLYLDAVTRAKTAEVGFTDINLGMLVVLGDQFLQKYLPTLLDENWKQLIETNLKPAVVAYTNYDLGNADAYWAQIAKIPNLDLRLQEQLSRIRDDLADAQAKNNSKKIAALTAELAQLTTKAQQDWLPINTDILFDHSGPVNARVLKGHIFVANNYCKNLPPSEFRDEEDADFITDFSITTVRSYFEQMVAAHMLSACIGSDDPQCKKGTAFAIDTVPQITCDNGNYKFDFGFRAKGFGLTSDIVGTVGNCHGEPCFKLVSSQTRLNGAIINFFVGGIVDRAINKVLKQVDSVPAPIPDVVLTQIESSPKTCSMRFKWNVQPPGEAAAPNLAY